MLRSTTADGDDVPREAGRGQRIVQFYENDAFLGTAVAHFIGSGLVARQPALVIATPAHQEAFRRALADTSIDVERACAAGQITFLDASDTLATFMVGDAPNPELFERHIGARIADIIAAQGRDNVTVRAFGEMVDLLWRGGNRSAAIASELEIANRTKDEFLATVSHELRTPMNAVLGWLRMLRAGTLDETKRDRALATVERNANAQRQLIEDLLDVSRIIAGKLRLDVGTVDVASVVENAIEVVRPAAQAKGLALHQTIDPTAGPILGDADRLQQVVWNLLTNAVKFTPKDGSVHIAVRRRDSCVEIIVADTGQGISAEFVPSVFERFRQADASSTRKHGGLGLGLAIVRSLVELHGGSVKAESMGLGKGATFTVVLPISPLRETSLERPPALRVPTAPELPSRHALGDVHVLVVDDEPDAREMLAEMLSCYDARVDVAASAADALRLVQESRPDVVVSDIGMPGEDGYALIRKLRALPAARGGKTPAVALTAYARFEDRTRALVAGFDMHLPKPVEPAELLAVLASLVARFGRKG